MADLDIISISRSIIRFEKGKITLNAGEKLSDDADVLAFAQKTVPVGKKIENLRIVVTGKVVDV